MKPAEVYMCKDRFLTKTVKMLLFLTMHLSHTHKKSLYSLRFLEITSMVPLWHSQVVNGRTLTLMILT